MIKVITYGTYDHLHQGHINLLKRAKALGNYLIVGVTSENFDITRGKINVEQSMMERIEAVKSLGIADLVIPEEYPGQKIDDIIKYSVDIFTVGSDWIGEFDYLNQYCKVIYLERTKGISSTEIRSNNKLRLGICGSSNIVKKYFKEAKLINGIDVTSIYSNNPQYIKEILEDDIDIHESFDNFLDTVDAIYIQSAPHEHYNMLKKALSRGIHCLVESPIVLKEDEYRELQKIASEKGLILMDSIKTCYSEAYHRLLLLASGNQIGKIISVDSVCTSLSKNYDPNKNFNGWNSITSWGPTGMLPIFQLLGSNYKELKIVTKFEDDLKNNDSFTKLNFIYDGAVASVKVGNGYKSEGTLVITGEIGCIFVPAPWWKTDYFEIHYEDSRLNKKYFFELSGEGIRNELVLFLKRINFKTKNYYMSDETSNDIIKVIEKFYNKDYIELK